MPLPYDLAISAYHTGIRLAAPWKPKAKQWIEGRKGLWRRLEAKRDALRGCLWMHCASVGEFEQGRPVLEAIKKERPDLPVLLTFFSPSGYQARKDFPLATHVEYLPPDGRANAGRLVALIKPRAALFIRYEFWHHHLHALKAAGVPTFLVSAIFREGQPFFRWYGGAWRAMLACYTHLFTQDDRSRDLLAGIGLKNVTVSGDTRFDRVMAIVQADEELSVARAFRDASPDPVLICGSTWPEDERLILEALDKLKGRPRIIIAPHELDPDQLRAIKERFPQPVVPWSEASAAPMGTWPHGHMGTLLIDRTGILSRLYKYGDIAYVGGGFTSGIHSILEAAGWGRPVIFGPKHTKFAEANGLIEAGGGWSVADAGSLAAVLNEQLGAGPRTASDAASQYASERTGATTIIARELLRRL